MGLRTLTTLALLLSAAAVRIQNNAPRRDVTGALMDVHDGNIVQWAPDGPYYWYGMGYRDCEVGRGLLPPQDCPGIYRPVSTKPCGFRLDHALNVYTSPDLVAWTFQGEALPVDGRPEGVYFRPKVIFNAKTQRFVLWINRLAASAANHTVPLFAYPAATYLVATSPSPAGPFRVATERAATSHSGGGDFDVLVSGDGAYLAYTAWSTDHRVSIERLDASFTDSTGETTGLLTAPWNEAPVLMQYRSWYYLLYGETCCFCREGGGAKVLVSPHPMGPWTDPDLDIAKTPGAAARSLSHSQQSFVFAARTPTGPVRVWCGDQWGTSPDKFKSHDLQYWVPMEWDDTLYPPLPRRLRLMDAFDLDLSTRPRPPLFPLEG